MIGAGTGTASGVSAGKIVVPVAVKLEFAVPPVVQTRLKVDDFEPAVPGFAFTRMRQRSFGARSFVLQASLTIVNEAGSLPPSVAVEQTDVEIVPVFCM